MHDLRVAVKRLRSYLRFKEQLTNENWKDSFAKVKTLFQSIGKLRDFDMSLLLVRKHERKEKLSLLHFKEYLVVNKSLTRRWTKQDSIKFNEQEISVFRQKFNLGLTKEEIIQKIFEFSATKIRKAKRLSNHFKKNAHEIRKLVKDAYYWLKICPEELVKKFIDIATMHRMLNYLGNWQDCFILAEKLDHYSKDLPKKNEEKEMLKQLKKKIEEDQDILLERAIKSWDKIEIKKATKLVALSAASPD